MRRTGLTEFIAVGISNQSARHAHVLCGQGRRSGGTKAEVRNAEAYMAQASPMGHFSPLPALCGIIYGSGAQGVGNDGIPRERTCTGFRACGLTGVLRV